MNAMLSKIDIGGRLIIPAQARKALHLESGGPVVLTLVDGELRVRSVASAMAELQAQASSVDALLLARRAEAAKEEGASSDTKDQLNATTTEADLGA
jgi:AbrB family looped-hinge helix DNA binding protein